MFKKVSIIGDGAMGTVCGFILCANGVQVRLWGYDATQLGQMAQARENVRFMPGYKFPDAMELVADDAKAINGAQLLVSAVPCQFMRSVWTRLKPYVPIDMPIISVAKGVENGTLLRPTEILADVLGRKTGFGVLSGPTIADELARQLPATACVACDDNEIACQVQETFSTSWFRVYTNTDVVGVELAGAMKNVIAIAAGAADGTGSGDNAKAALLARGLAEIKRLGLAMGAKDETFAGLSGLGDLVTTCISPLGRNRSFGERVGRGATVKEALEATNSVVEGVATCKSVMGLASKYKVEMPISEAIYAVLFDGVSVKKAISALMTRKLKSEV